jgi:hypothetical protein
MHYSGLEAVRPSDVMAVMVPAIFGLIVPLPEVVTVAPLAVNVHLSPGGEEEVRRVDRVEVEEEEEVAVADCVAVREVGDLNVRCLPQTPLRKKNLWKELRLKPMRKSIVALPSLMRSSFSGLEMRKKVCRWGDWASSIYRIRNSVRKESWSGQGGTPVS